MIQLMVLSLFCFQEMTQKVEMDINSILLQVVDQDLPVFKVEELLNGGANPNAGTKDNVVPLMLCSYLGNIKTTRLLLERGALVDVLDAKGNSALIYSVAQNREESNSVVTSYLLSKGADVNVVTKNGDTPLLILTRSPKVILRLKDMETLLNAGANVNARDAEKNTPLMQLIIHAANGVEQESLTPLILKLLEKEPDLDLVDKNGLTALKLAQKVGNAKWVEAIQGSSR